MSKFLRFIKIEHTLFSLPVVLAGAFLAVELRLDETWPPASVWLWTFLAVLGARSAGFAMNRVIDSEIDARNPRTKNREIPSGQISRAAAWAFIAVSSAIFLTAAAVLSPLCLALAPIPLVFFAVYPYLKRFTMWAHFGLGLAWGIAPLGGWLAVAPELSPIAELAPAFLLAAFSVLWVAGFDIIYALLDEQFDRQAGLHSMPARLGGKDAIMISELTHFAAFLFLGLLVQQYLHNPWAFALLALSGALLAASHWKVGTRPLTPEVIDFAFFKVNAALGFVVLGIVLSETLR